MELYSVVVILKKINSKIIFKQSLKCFIFITHGRKKIN